MDVAEIQLIDSTSDSVRTRRTTNATTARRLVENKRPNKAHVSHASCLTSKLLPQPVTEPGCNLLGHIPPMSQLLRTGLIIFTVTVSNWESQGIEGGLAGPPPTHPPVLTQIYYYSYKVI